VKEHLADDLMAITERAKTAWAPRLRNGFTLMYPTKPSMKVYKNLKAKGKSLSKKIKKSRRRPKTIETSGIKHQFGDNGSSNNDITQNEEDRNDEINATLFFEGDCFYEAEESLIEQSDEEDNDRSSPKKECKTLLDEWVPFDEPPLEGFEEVKTNDTLEIEDVEKKETPDSIPGVLLEETPLPRMFIPGKIIHIYTHRGGYKAAVVPRAFRELRRISLAGSMLNDHMSKSYYEALLECKTVRNAKEELPAWTGFSEEMTCYCCASRFTWASTSDSEAQEARDRHNCRACGGLVCGACSSNQVPLPDVGINTPSRVCDRCYHDMGTDLGSNHDALTRSFTEECENENYGQRCISEVDNSDKSNRDKLYPKRNPLVDELAMRMPSAAI